MSLPWTALTELPARGFEPDPAPLGFTLPVGPGGYA